MERQNDSIVIYSTVWCPDCRRAKEFLNKHQVPYQNVNIEEDLQALAFVEQVNGGMHVVPTIAFPDGTILAEPSNLQLATKLGLRRAQPAQPALA